MYCINCGVELQKGAQRCPLCNLRVYHPELSEAPEAAPYPPRAAAKPRFSRGGLLFVITLMFSWIVFCSVQGRPIGAWFMPVTMVGLFAPTVYLLIVCAKK